MKYPEYDSPFQMIVEQMATEIAKQVDEYSYKAVQRAGISVDKEKLLQALACDKERYREAFRKGRETGYQEREEQNIRCGNCKWGELTLNGNNEEAVFCYNGETGIEDGFLHSPDWYCAEGEKIE